MSRNNPTIKKTNSIEIKRKSKKCLISILKIPKKRMHTKAKKKFKISKQLIAEFNEFEFNLG